MTEEFQVGAITQTHGIRGEVKVFPTTDDVKRYKKLKSVCLDNGKLNIELEIESVKFFKQYVIVKFKGIDDINDVEKYRKFELFVDREHAVKLQKDEYFIADLIDANVYDENDKLLGVITDVLQTGANDVYQVEIDEEYIYEGKHPQEKEVLLPAIKECIKSVDLENGRVDAVIMKGLL